MILVLHIIIALSSIGYTTYLFISPSQKGLQISYALIAATLASGTYLAVTQPVHILQSCATGLVYIGAMVIGVAVTRNKLASALS